MRRVELGFGPRLKVLEVLANTQAADGGLDKLRALLAVHTKVSFTDEENARITELASERGSTFSLNFACPGCAAVTMRERGGRFVCSSCRADQAENPEPGLCRATVELEQAEAAWLLKVLRAWEPRLGIVDLGWYEPLVESLSASDRREPAMKFKRGGKRG